MIKYLSLLHAFSFSLSGFRTCYHLEFRCDNGQCVRPYSVCDGRTQCKDGSDEKDCQPSGQLTVKALQKRCFDGRAGYEKR
ncbi:Low-density lipoprotein receptor-related protein 4 [Portunus trituberculatus]|uniref:Low-density lipoprotein receptor-related protein 4 n=1 Tax=Portunus trituberculatus TaxID=210409 RepID=A0A5B7HZF0_PORTR|nr:Low-density lipoprotein receptor-related protein 4 [Portunus trituberculatus]